MTERPKYLKLNSAAPSRSLKSPLEITSLRRHKSETDLLSEDSFNNPPRILGRKKDNTLISKIYQDPHVRKFALSSRDHLPVETVNYGRYDGNQLCYNSDDGFPRRKLLSYDDDLLSSNVVRKNEQFRGLRRVQQNLEKGQRQHIYSSSEDLLGNDECEKTSPRKDNTIVSKIYQDPNVRSFALTNKERESLRKKSYSSEEDVFSNKSSPGSPKLSSTRSESCLNDTITKNEIEIKTRFVHTPDPDIDELSKKQIVHNILDRMSRSRDVSQERGRKDGYITDEEINVSVKDLRKLFESNEITGKVISSLTARSLSKQIREDLKQK
ncbi:unnamed protein product [Acanthoscelides obtectus]|uniref:Uncharacterized protein n=1 Tax=Acanthoscelides obtectus TaxID=200917 RepID=A0A9P0LH19_ACAOB|nr:unnamed protein product [Acanthoscelides obtectus]CAK1630157.1 hypothetical protein AOBTE_LOCUS6181 [Acanthoscelides obtectus]